MNKNKYEQGKQICEKIFQMTGDIKYHNMMNGFKELSQEKEHEKSDGCEREF